MMRTLHRLIASITLRLSARRLQRAIPKPNPFAAACMDLDYLSRARSRSRVRMACSANDLDSERTNQVLRLFDARWQLSMQRQQSATEREAQVTQYCIECTACIASSQRTARPAPDFLRV